ncbi:hypothetical protein ACFVMC_18275 [Nocardia sp. NPDC127579]|uniref:hypothetical protein n=1 Tax=Nocardia sp. NPDC127579 TaxID=3345402 RepID=UPI0036373EB6
MPLDLIVVSEQLATVDHSAVATLERQLGVEMPSGYAEFMAAYGEGTVCDELNVWGPQRILNRVEQARETWVQDWFWEHPRLAPGDFADAVPVGDSSNGDQLAYLPRHGLVLLPRHRDGAIDAGTSYTRAVQGFCTDGTLVAPSAVLWFESWVQQSCYENWSGGDRGRVRDAVAALGLHVAVDAPDPHAITFLLPAMGGHVYIMEAGTQDLHVHVRFEPQHVAVYTRIAAALTAAGTGGRIRWGAEPAEPHTSK